MYCKSQDYGMSCARGDLYSGQQVPFQGYTWLNLPIGKNKSKDHSSLAQSISLKFVQRLTTYWTQARLSTSIVNHRLPQILIRRLLRADHAIPMVLLSTDDLNGGLDFQFRISRMVEITLILTAPWVGKSLLILLLDEQRAHLHWWGTGLYWACFSTRMWTWDWTFCKAEL